MCNKHLPGAAASDGGVQLRNGTAKLALYVWSPFASARSFPLQCARLKLKTGWGACPGFSWTPSQNGALLRRSRRFKRLCHLARQIPARIYQASQLRPDAIAQRAACGCASATARGEGLAPSAATAAQTRVRAHDQASFTRVRPVPVLALADDFARLYRRGLGVCPNAVPNTGETVAVLR
jgi:hypothetical protein